MLSVRTEESLRIQDLDDGYILRDNDVQSMMFWLHLHEVKKEKRKMFEQMLSLQGWILDNWRVMPGHLEKVLDDGAL